MRGSLTRPPAFASRYSPAPTAEIPAAPLPRRLPLGPPPATVRANSGFVAACSRVTAKEPSQDRLLPLVGSGGGDSLVLHVCTARLLKRRWRFFCALSATVEGAAAACESLVGRRDNGFARRCDGFQGLLEVGPL